MEYLLRENAFTRWLIDTGRKLTQPVPFAISEADRRRSWAISAFFLLYFLSGIILVPFTPLAFIDTPYASGATGQAYIAMCLYSLGYFFSRTRFYKWTPHLTVWVYWLPCIHAASIIPSVNDAFVPLVYTVNGVAIAGIMLSPRWTLFYAIIQLFLLAAGPRLLGTHLAATQIDIVVVHSIYLSFITILGSWLRANQITRLVQEKEHVKDLQEQMQKSDTQYHALMDQAGDMIFQLTHEGKILAANNTVRSILGYDPSHILGWSIQAIDVDGRLTAGVAATMSQEMDLPPAVYGSLRHANHGQIPVEMRVGHFAENKQEIFLAIMRDITERRFAEKMIADQRLHLFQQIRMSSLGTMAAGIAHEVNNPLAVIKLRASLIAQLDTTPQKNPKRMASFAEDIQRTVRYIADIIDGLQKFSLDEADKPARVYPLKEIVQDALAFCRERFRGKSIDLGIAMPVEDIEVRCHPNQIAQILLNLLTNAYDAVQHASHRWVRLEIQCTESAVDLRVIDSGPGIPTERREKIFEPFFTTKDVGQGTGLGLSISQGLASLNNGELRLEDKNLNTTFVLRLPLASQQKPMPAVELGPPRKES